MSRRKPSPCDQGETGVVVPHDLWMIDDSARCGLRLPGLTTLLSIK